MCERLDGHLCTSTKTAYHRKQTSNFKVEIIKPRYLHFQSRVRSFRLDGDSGLIDSFRRAMRDLQNRCEAEMGRCEFFWIHWVISVQ